MPLLATPAGLGSAALLIFMVLAALAAPVLAPYDPNQVDLTKVYLGPGSEHWLGTDGLGRDLLSRALFGARTSFRAALLAVSVALAIGCSLGLLAGYAGKGLDRVLSSIIDALMSVPSMILAMVIIVALGRGLTSAMIAVGFVAAPSFFRVTRAAVIDARHEGFVETAVMIGCSPVRVVLVHILPRCLTPITVVAVLAVGYAIIAEAGLSYLGLASRPPTASWGSMLAEATARYDLPYLLAVPTTCLVVTALAFTLLGEEIRKLDGSAKTRDGEE